MKHCHQCNLSFPDHYRYCGLCGGGLAGSTTCRTCGAKIESRWQFCTICGKPLAPTESPMPVATQGGNGSPAQKLPQTPPAESIKKEAHQWEWFAAPELLDEPDEITAPSLRLPEAEMSPAPMPPRTTPVAIPENRINALPGRKAPPTLTMLSGYGQTEPAAEPARPYSILLGLALIAILFLVGIGGWYAWSRRASAATASGHVDSSGATANSAAPKESATYTNNAAVVPPAAPVTSVDDEWKRLRDQRINAQPSERAAIVDALKEAERKFASDYRFPYERAKLLIKGVASHDEAFAALAIAAERAIDNSKAKQMQDDLTVDKEGDFWKLARGHHEWHKVLDALTSKDKSFLASVRH